MKKLLASALVLLMSVPLFAQNGDTRGLKTVVGQLAGQTVVVGKQYAVLIAINKYKNWMALRNPVKDAKEIKEILARRYYISDFMELYDEAATKAGIMKLFTRLLEVAKPEDSILIYYAGHGHLDTSSNSGFWIPVDGGLDAFEQANWLPNSQIRGLISNLKARHVALIADSCFSGDILNPTRGITPSITDEYFKNAYARVSRQVLTSGSSESVPDESSFSRQLKLALEGNTSPYLDPLMLYNQIRLGVTQSTPLFGDLKDTGHQEGSSFLLFLKQGTASGGPPEAAATAGPARTTFQVQKLFGKVSISTKTSGTFVLDGQAQGHLGAGQVATLENVEFGAHEFVMRYEGGQTEKISLTIDSEEPQTVKFVKAPAAASGEPTAGLDELLGQTRSYTAPQASIKIDGNFDDWNAIPPAFSGSGLSGNLHFAKVYLALDSQRLYVRFDINDTTPVSFFHQHNFDVSHANSQCIIDIGDDFSYVLCYVVYINSEGRWCAVIGKYKNGKYQDIDRTAASYSMKGSSLEAAFPLGTIRKNLDVPVTGTTKIRARMGYNPNPGTWTGTERTDWVSVAF